jgi:hypothetical protein
MKRVSGPIEGARLVWMTRTGAPARTFRPPEALAQTPGLASETELSIGRKQMLSDLAKNLQSIRNKLESAPPRKPKTNAS